MNFLLNLSILTLSLALLSSCSSSKMAENASEDKLNHWLTIEKLPCFGHCQVFQLKLYRNGLVILEGKDHMDKKGVFFTELSKEKVKNLQFKERSVQWNQIKNEYLVNIADLPMMNITYHDMNGARLKSIQANSNLPDALHEFIKTASETIDKEKWTLVQRKSEMNNPELLYNELMVDMDSSLTVEMLEQMYADYDLMRISRVSPLMNLWHLRYNEEKIGRYEILVTLRKKNGIRHVSFNRKILPREE